MITLNELAYNIKNIAYGGSSNIEGSINIRQIKHWIHYHRLKLIIDNINKGVLDNSNFYQRIGLSTYNSASSILINYIANWEKYEKGQTTTNPFTQSPNKYVLNHPKVDIDGKLNGEWITYGSLTAESSGKWRDARNKNPYGIKKPSSGQTRGDYRNYSGHSFYVPTLFLPGDINGTCNNVYVFRYIHSPDSNPIDGSEIDMVDDQSDGWDHHGIDIPYDRGRGHAWLEHGKFKKHAPSWSYNVSTIHSEKEFKGKSTAEKRIITVNNLMSSPCYLGNLDAPGEEKLYWKYRGYLKGIFQNPTDVANDSGPLWYSDMYKTWDDSNTPYPIAMEYVSDLIQRVIQIEMQTTLKTMPDIITDGMDDTVRKNISSGAQVQR